jgi:hypothetical protein
MFISLDDRLGQSEICTSGVSFLLLYLGLLVEQSELLRYLLLSKMRW